MQRSVKQTMHCFNVCAVSGCFKYGKVNSKVNFAFVRFFGRSDYVCKWCSIIFKQQMFCFQTITHLNVSFLISIIQLGGHLSISTTSPWHSRIWVLIFMSLRTTSMMWNQCPSFMTSQNILFLRKTTSSILLLDLDIAENGWPASLSTCLLLLESKKVHILFNTRTFEKRPRYLSFVESFSFYYFISYFYCLEWCNVIDGRIKLQFASVTSVTLS